MEENLRQTGVSNVSTNEVGKAILPFLRDLDVVAYLRFASVYQAFDTLDDFAAAIEELRERQSGAAAKPRRPRRRKQKKEPEQGPTLLDS